MARPVLCATGSKLSRTTRDLVLPWLAQRQDVCISLAQEYFVGLQPDPVFAGVCGRMLALGGSRPKRFWCSFGARLASYSDGCKDVGKLADAMLALAAGPVHARRSRQPVRPTVLQSILQHEGAAVKCAARRQIREYLVMFVGWN